MRKVHVLLALLLWPPFVGPSALTPGAQEISKSDLDRKGVLEMLNEIARDVQNQYYDTGFHGVDWSAKVQETREKIKGEDSLNRAIGDIAVALDTLNDSHTIFLPPPRTWHVSFDLQTEIIGDTCYVVRVRPGGTAATEGVDPGDEVLMMQGYAPSRENLWRLNFRIYTLEPQAELLLSLRKPSGLERQVTIKAKIEQTPGLAGPSGMGDYYRDPRHVAERESLRQHPRYAEIGHELLIVKVPAFLPDQEEIDSILGKARKHQTMILDLRGNAGGDPGRLEYLVGALFPKDVKIADRVGRRESKPIVSKSRRQNAFSGKLIVLIDSRTASGSELFARVVQIEQRGIVVGDHSSGKVMEAKFYPHHLGGGPIIPYGAWISEFDLIMSDGKSLEHTGVTPDKIVLPGAQDIAAGRDPVLAYAALLLGVTLTSDDAGKLFPYQWPVP